MASDKIFINYRRGSGQSWARLLYSTLGEIFGPSRLFMDVDVINPGQDFVRVLEDEVAQTGVMVCLITSDWFDARDDDGKLRLENEYDFVRIELEAAFDRNIPVLPVLVDNALMPTLEQLPNSIRQLAYRQAVQLRHESYSSDIKYLIQGLSDIVGITQIVSKTHTQNLYQAIFGSIKSSASSTIASLVTTFSLAINLFKKENSNSSVLPLADIEKYIYQARESGATLDDICSLLEQLNWRFISQTGSDSEIETHLKRFDQGVTKPLALGQLEYIFWERANTSKDIDDVINYLDRFPAGAYCDIAIQMRDLMLENAGASLVAEGMPRIFINYRRIDSQDSADRIHEYLAAKFSKNNVVIDVDKHSIVPGRSIVEQLNELVSSCNIMLVLIRNRWISELRRRAEKHESGEELDFVRAEIKAALNLYPNMIIVPTFLADTEIPQKSDLPPDVQPLLGLGGCRITRDHFSKDLQELVERVAPKVSQ